MSSDAAKDAIRYLDQEIAASIDRSEKGRWAHEQANLTGPSHISAIIVSNSDEFADGRALVFKAFVELHDPQDNQYEAEITGTVEKLDDDGRSWKIISLQVLDAGPLPKSG